MSKYQSMKILVAGGTGAVGRHICREVVRTLGPRALVVGDYNLDRGRDFSRSISESAGVAELDVSDRRSVERATEGVDAVIVAVRQLEPVVQAVCTERGIHSVDIVPDTPLARSVFSPVHGDFRSAGGAGMNPLSGVVGAGLIPGLSGLMARHMIEKTRAAGSNPTGPIVQVSLLQRKNGTAGAAGIADMLGLFARPLEYEGRRVPGFTLRRVTRFPPPFGDRTMRLVAFPEATDVRSHFGIEGVHYWTAFDNEPFNRTIGTLNRLGVLNRFRRPGGGARLATFLARGKARAVTRAVTREETVALAAESGDFAVSLTAPSDYGGTAIAAVAMTRTLLARGIPDYGVVLPFQLFSLAQIAGMANSPEIRIYEAEPGDPGAGNEGPDSDGAAGATRWIIRHGTRSVRKRES
ncbi:MAG: NAD-dependent epimerase/dehydratase family protein [Spirochaetaceae bacterium]|nr:MAG: NAD-dependent epimerase/dehydratase family protein [Spirochaetaceae bacterium]